MAATTDEVPKPEKNRSRTELWVLAVVAAVALLCVSLLALALVLVAGKGSLIQVNPVFNGGAAGPSSAQALITATPQEPQGSPPADRGASQSGSGPSALPIAAPSPASVPSLVPTAIPISAPTMVPSPPSPVCASATPALQDLFSIRGDASKAYSGNQALPMPGAAPGDLTAFTTIDVVQPVLAAVPGYPVRASASVAVPMALPTPAPTAVPTAVPTLPPTALPTAVPTAVPTTMPTALPTAVPTTMSTALPTALPSAVSSATAPLPTAVPGAVPLAQAGAAASTASAPTAPPVTYAPASGQGALADLRLLSASSTASLAGYSGSPGNLFFTADVLIVNKGANLLTVDGNAFNLVDADGNSYMVVPGPAAAPSTVPSGGKTGMTVTFLVPNDAVLQSLSLVLPSETDLVPLARK